MADENYHLESLNQGKAQLMSSIVEIIPTEILEPVKKFAMQGLFSESTKIKHMYTHVFSVVLKKIRNSVMTKIERDFRS